jgi:hypothetical protein
MYASSSSITLRWAAYVDGIEKTRNAGRILMRETNRRHKIWTTRRRLEGKIKMFCHAFMAPWLMITGSGLDDWIYWHLPLQSVITARDWWLPNTRSIPSWTTSVFCCDWLCSDLRVRHFFSFRCPLVNTQLLDCLPTESPLTQSIACPPFITSRRTEYKTLPSRFHFSYSVFIRCRVNAC